jgi:transcription initiation factor TFIIB
MAESLWHGDTSSRQTESLDRCDVCGGRLIKDFERGQYVCKECGTVLDHLILSPECELSFSNGDHAGKSYASGIYDSGPPTTITFHDLGISSEISGGFRDAKGNTLGGKARYRAILLRKWHSRTRTKDSRDLSIAKALTSINDLADRLGLPTYVREEACTIYRRIAEKRLTAGRCISVFVAVSLYAAIRRSKLPLMLRDVLPILQVSLSEFNAYLNIMKVETEVTVPPPDPVAWISKIASQCNFSQQSQVLAAKYVRVMAKVGETFGMLPHVIAAIALHRMGATIGDKKNVNAIAKAAKCAVVSIQKGFVSESEALRELKNRKKAALSPEATSQIQVGLHPRQVHERSRVSGNYSSLLYAPELESKVRA